MKLFAVIFVVILIVLSFCVGAAVQKENTPYKATSLMCLHSDRLVSSTKEGSLCVANFSGGDVEVRCASGMERGIFIKSGESLLIDSIQCKNALD